MMTKQEIAEMLADGVRGTGNREYEVKRYLKMTKPMLNALLEIETAPTKQERRAAYHRFTALSCKRVMRKPQLASR